MFLKTLVGLLKPDRGSIFIRDVNLAKCCEHKLYETRKLFGVLFQDGALFGSMNLFDNIAFPLREHTRKTEAEIRRIVGRRWRWSASTAPRRSCPARSPAACASGPAWPGRWCSTPRSSCSTSPTPGSTRSASAYLNQLIVDLNAQTDATFLIVTHDIGIARTVPDNLGMLFRRELVMFGPREVLLTCDEPVVEQFLNGRRRARSA